MVVSIKHLVILMLFSIIFFIVGVNVGMHGVSLSNTNGSSANPGPSDHLWLKITSVDRNTVEHQPDSSPIIRDVGGEKIVVNAVENYSYSRPSVLPTPLTTSVSKLVVADTLTSTPLPIREPNTVALTSPPHKHIVLKTKGDSVYDIYKMVDNRSSSLDNMITQQQTQLIEHSSGVLAKYVESGELIPIIILTCNRVELLDSTLQNLLQARGISKKYMAIMQDGSHQGIANIAKKYGIQLVQNTVGLYLRGGIPNDGGSRIATHYKYSLSKAFDVIFPSAPAIIIVEDDLLFSPDFYEYFHAVSPIMDIDKSLLVISAWNDNGFRGKACNKWKLKRTEFFPGLGWLLTRSLYKGELEKKWPTNHWDHWLRYAKTHNGRDVLYPEVPRTYHKGITGTFMNIETHNKYFRDIDYNLDPSIVWHNKSVISGSPLFIPQYITGLKDIYMQSVMERLKKCTHITSVAVLYDVLLSSGNWYALYSLLHTVYIYTVGATSHISVFIEPKIICLFIRVDPNENRDFREISKFFNIWHEYKRGSYRGLHEFYWKQHYIMLSNTGYGNNLWKQSFDELKPNNVQIIQHQSFDYDTLSYKMEMKQQENLELES